MARVLVIEDNTDNLRLVTFLLEAFGHEVEVAGSGNAGVAAAAEARPDLILLDLQMPEMDGFEVIRRLRAVPGLAGRPIVALTAYAMAGDEERVLAAGFDGYLTKPITPETFEAEVAAQLQTVRGKA
jgi:two-component system cell cycle response regulator